MDTEEKKFPRGVKWGVAALVIIFVVAAGYSAYQESKKTAVSLNANLAKFREGVADLKNFQTGAAQGKFSDAGQGLSSFGGFWSQLQYVFGGAGEVVSGFKELAGKSAAFSGEISYLQNNFFDLLAGRNGNEILAHLKAAKSDLDAIGEQSDKISSAASKISALSPGAADFYIPLQLDLSRTSEFLGSLIGWLATAREKHIFVMFQNPSEIRPAGGFLGSYADVVFDGADFKSAEVHDINDADRLLDLKIIPPAPLQAQVSRWRAADANWFFDFPASAAQVLKFVESSKLYAASSTTFDGAVAVSPKVVSDILSVTGPIKLIKAKITLNADNFLTELQKQVQLGQVSSATYPKSALKEFASELIPAIAALTTEQKQQISGMVADWLNKKDLMFYFKDAGLQKFVDYYGASGAVYGLPQDFEGDYLAVVDANIGGGKSDLFIKQDIALTSQINSDGTVSDHLVVNRAHEGNNSKYWWYKTTNQDYLQIFTPPMSRLVNFHGGIEKTINPPVSYAKSGFAADDFVAQVESSTEKLFNYPAVLSYREFGKNVFATWSRVASGGKTEVDFDYTHRLPIAPADGQTYQFIFEKQAGTERNYKFILSAPVGFRFRENNLPVYEYDSNDPLTWLKPLQRGGGPPGRLVINLTLEKI